MVDSQIFPTKQFVVTTTASPEKKGKGGWGRGLNGIYLISTLCKNGINAHVLLLFGVIKFHSCT